MSTAELSERPLSTAEWLTMGTTARVVVTDLAQLAAAERIVVAELAALDQTCSRFRSDAEIHRIADANGRPLQVSPLLAEAVAVALDAAQRTDGDIDPTVATALPGWQEVYLDPETRMLTAPARTQLDLGATAKAWAADRCAARVDAELGCGVLVSLGGDLATAGQSPPGGWTVRVQDRSDRVDTSPCTVTLSGGMALATSSTNSRAWRLGRSTRRHLLDPRTLMPASVVWRYASVAAASCVDANIASTAALIRGHAAPQWLADLGVAARLVAADGSVRTIGDWPRQRPLRHPVSGAFRRRPAVAAG
jgi:thiamine biosynthesis lipoprotein